METPYSKAWKKFEQSGEYANQIAIMKQAEPLTRQIYFENRIRKIFNAGWNARDESKK